MSDRLVLVRVTDPEVARLSVDGVDRKGRPVDGACYSIPVPEDDQLHEDLDLLTTSGRN